MSTPIVKSPSSEGHAAEEVIPPLEAGDRIDQPTFHQRYEAMPHGTRAELIGGVVHMPSPLKRPHGRMHYRVIRWIGDYEDKTPGIETLDSATNILGAENEPQPDVCLRILSDKGGQTSEKDDYIVGPPELIVEVASSTESIDLHGKKADYERYGAREYLVVALRQRRVFWFISKNESFSNLAPGSDGILRSEVFPGLWLDPAALLADDVGRVRAVLAAGLASPEHAAFVGRALPTRETPDAAPATSTSRSLRPPRLPSDGRFRPRRQGDPCLMYSTPLLLGRYFLVLALAAFALSPARVQPAKPSLPRVVLVGDSIRLGYAPLVAKRLEGKAEVISPAGAGDSAWLLKNLDAFVLREKPALVHFNVGLHDLRLDKKTKTHQVELDLYEKNLETIVARLKKESSATLIFATTTPIDDERHAKRGGFDRFEKDVRRYNAAALKVLAKQQVVAHDLHFLVTHAGASKLLAGDGTHYTAAGKQRQADAVVDCVLRHLAIRSAPRKPAAKPDPEATAKYKKAEARLDAMVPPAYKKPAVPEFAVPTTAEEWKKRRPQVLDAVRRSLGDLPPRPKPGAALVSREIHPAFILESLTIPNGVDSEMTAMLLLPHERKTALPAVLWLHSSSYDHNQLLMRGYNGGEEPLGKVLVRPATRCSPRMLAGTAADRVRDRRALPRPPGSSKRRC